MPRPPTRRWQHDNGNTLVDSSGNTYTYDAWNHEVAVKNASGGNLASYTYDANGNRISQTESGNTTDFYLSAGGQTIEERQGTTTTAQNVWGITYINDLVQRTVTTTAGTSVYYIQHDANFNTTAVTDASGNVLERYTYLPYGTATVLNANWTMKGDGTIASSTVGLPFLFQGGRLDPTTGEYHYGARDETTYGRWMQQDPAAVGINWYQFVDSSPIGAVDATGLDSDPIMNDLQWGGAPPISREMSDDIASLVSLCNSWTEEGYFTAADMLSHFLFGQGKDLELSGKDTDEIKGNDQFLAAIAANIKDKFPNAVRKGTTSVTDVSGKFDHYFSMGVSDNNLFYAFGTLHIEYVGKVNTWTIMHGATKRRGAYCDSFKRYDLTVTITKNSYNFLPGTHSWWCYYVPWFGEAYDVEKAGIGFGFPFKATGTFKLVNLF